MSTIEKAFQIIEEIISHQDNGLSFPDILRTEILPKTSTHRLLRILVDIGYLIFDQDTKRYRGSLKLARLGSLVIENINLKNIAHSYLQSLKKITGHTCHLGIMNETKGVYLDIIESKDYGIKLFSEVGKEFPLHCTGLGKILLAFLEPSQRSQIIKGNLEKYTVNTITDLSALEAELRTVKKNAYALDSQEITRGIMCIAAPVFDYKGKVAAGISATFPSYLADESDLKQDTEAVTKCAAQVTRVMGGKANLEKDKVF